MTTELAKQMMEEINSHYTWIRACDYACTHTSMVCDDGRLRRYAVNAFRLEVRVPNYGYHQGRIINLPEKRIDLAIEKLFPPYTSHEPRSPSSITPTYEDINRIFLDASWGALHLDLEA